MNRQNRYTHHRWLLALVLAGLLATSSFSMPILTATAYACQMPGGGC